MFKCLLIILWAYSSSIWSNSELLHHTEFQVFLQKMVKEQGFNRHDLQTVFAQAEYKPDIIEKMTRPYESKPWDVYRQLFLTPTRIEQGLSFWKAHARTLSQAERTYGVPAAVIVGILGVETIYGRQQGSYRVIDALTTLAFYFPKRAAYFKYELEQYLLMCRQYHLDPMAQLGSYAGAMGQGQFMPGSYLRWAVKYQGQGAPDIIHNSDDAIFSIANYLQQHGWHARQKIAQAAQWEKKCQNMQVNLKRANYSYRYLSRCGVKPLERVWQHPNDAGLLALDMSQGNAEYWIAYPNFYVILSYNSSPLYGLAVYLLGQSISEKV